MLVPSVISTKPIKTTMHDQLEQTKGCAAAKDLIKSSWIELLKAGELWYYLTLKVHRDLLVTTMPCIPHVTDWTARGLKKASIFFIRLRGY